ncbi:65-kDa microtubule-associated protein 3-like isoform X1 [Chenopodium quinoa]|uniref:65-kDa microtubule-associated protein 3-like isoform X1 n=1 Tax=Chenopodium quinoa TaxID=63459 RepID=UPI000B785D59|nr:65-kDa microtubule-associated protein 3-like isoform X1 [Chenopodium quinoa]
MDIRISSVFLRMETTCESLLIELKEIWDEVGEDESGRDAMLLEIEQECLEVYTRKVDQAYQYRAQLRQAIADAESELAQIFSSLGERPINIRQPEKAVGLKEELNMIIPFLEEMRKRKSERKQQFVEVLDQISNISSEIHRSAADSVCQKTVDENDLSLKRLEDLHTRLLALQKEKSDRLKQFLDDLSTLNSLCAVLGMEFRDQICDINPTLDDSKGIRNISDDTIQRLSNAIHNLRETKIQRLRKLQDLASTMLELWNLMDTPPNEQHMFHNVTSKIAASELEITEPNCLSMDFINHVETEVTRLENLKSSKMKELILKKKSELEEICRQTHMIIDAQILKHFSVEAIDSGVIDLSYMLEQMELQISNAKEEAFSRKDILERVEKWKAECEEESWLEEYSMDESRYYGGRGGHLSLKRAEKARTQVNKIPAMVDTLTSKIQTWEKEREAEFFYDGLRLLSMLEDYIILRQEKEKERQRQRDQKKLQGRLLAEKEARFGSKPSPTKSVKKAPRYSMSVAAAANRRYSVSGAMLQRQNFKTERTALHSHPIKKLAQFQDEGKRNNTPSGQLHKKQAKTINSKDFGSPKKRKPFALIRDPVTEVLHPTNTTEKQNMTPSKTLSAGNTPISTPSKLKSDENGNNSSTPKKVATPVKVSPSTLSIRSVSPYTPASVKAVEVEKDDNPEYSFEELRAGYFLPQKTALSALQYLDETSPIIS